MRNSLNSDPRTVPAISSMLESTFIHARGIGRNTELRLWECGARTWQDYLEGDERDWPLSALQRAMLTETVQESVERLDNEDFAWFAEALPAAEHWRAVPAFGHRLAFLDIETNGGMGPNDITVIGLYDGRKMHQFVAGDNLHTFPEAMEEAAMIVTFFGTGFDLPFIRRAFPQLRLPQLHVDLCYMLRRLGYKGGLKSIEHQMGISRSSGTTGLSGLDAVRLWQQYRMGHAASLETLLAYNAEDVRNMADLLSEGYKKLARKVLIGEA
jgi:uncharacterized protein